MSPNKFSSRIPSARTALRCFALFALAAGLSGFAAAQTAPAPPAAPAAAPTTLPPMNGIAHIAIRVKDIAASLDFYHKLGFDQAFANTSADGTVTQSFVKLNDRQYFELYPVTARDTQVGFMHLCFEAADINGLHDYYVAEGLTPISVRKAAAGNLLFTLKGPEQPVGIGAQNIEYTQYMPGSRHTLDFGQHLSPDRVAEKMTVVALAMQDPAVAQMFYLSKLSFTQSKIYPDRLDLPGVSGQQVEIVPGATLGAKSSILLESSNLDKAAAQLTRQQVAFQRADSSYTDARGRTVHVQMISVTDPDGNIIRIQAAQ
jgi:catechol 2,3-dioxygenase-like lactoylglutathione lyase family enzyme